MNSKIGGAPEYFSTKLEAKILISSFFVLYNIFSNTDINGNTPLVQAVIKDNYEIFEFLFLKTLDLVERTLDPKNIGDLNKIDNFSIIKALTLSSQLGNSKMTNLILSRIESSPFATLLNKNNLASCISHLIINEDDDAVKKILQFNEKKIGTKLEASIFPATLKGSVTKVLFFNMGEDESEFTYKIMQGLREEGISSEMFHEQAKLDKQFKYAEKKGIEYVVIIGSKEMQSSTCIVKQLSSGVQQEMNTAKLVEFFR